VAGEGVKIGAQRTHVNARVRHGLRPVDQHHRAEAMGSLDDALYRQHRAERVGHVRHRHQPRARVEELEELLQLQLAAAVDRRHFQRAARLLAHHLPGDYVGVMLERADEDLVACPQARAGVGLRDQVDPLGGAADKNDLARRAGIDEAPYALAGAFITRRWPPD